MIKPIRANGREVRFSVRATRQNLAYLVEQSAYQGQRTLICRYGFPMAAIVPMRDLIKLRAAGRADGSSLDELPRLLGWK